MKTVWSPDLLQDGIKHAVETLGGCHITCDVLKRTYGKKWEIKLSEWCAAEKLKWEWWTGFSETTVQITEKGESNARRA